jgi:hypothetical protein
MTTLIQAPVAKPAKALRAKTCTCVVCVLTSNESQNERGRTALRIEITDMTLKQPKRSAKYAGRMRPRIELPLQEVRYAHGWESIFLNWGDRKENGNS